MAKKKVEVSQEIRDFLSQNGKMGGQTTRKLIEMGKKYAEENNIAVDETDEDERPRHIRRAS